MRIVSPSQKLLSAFLSKAFFLRTSFFLLVLCGCNNGGDLRVKAQTKAEGTSPLARVNTNLPALYLERNDFLDIDSAKYKDKLVLQLYHPKDSALFLLAIHPASRKNIVFDETKIKYPRPFANGLDFSDKTIFLGDQQTKKGELEELVQEIKRYPLIRYILFEPQIDKDNHLYYTITGVEKLPRTLQEKGFSTAVYHSSPTPPAKLR